MKYAIVITNKFTGFKYLYPTIFDTVELAEKEKAVKEQNNPILPPFDYRPNSYEVINIGVI